MKREIKFRAWDAFRSKMRNDFTMVASFEEDGSIVEYPDVTIMQYTGLKDKNGKEIYEGDLCYTNNETYGIELRDIGGAYLAVNINKEEREEDIHFLLNCNHFLEVIGNIHENPELLKHGSKD